MRKTWVIAGVIGVALAAGGAWWTTQAPARAAAAGQNGDKKSEKAAPPLVFRASEVVRPQRQAMPEEVVFSGALAAPRTALVRAKASGTLLSLSVAEGSRVQAGQVLGAIDVSDLNHRLAERHAGVEAAQARVAEAERVHRSNEDLARQQFISPNALESSRAALESARAQLKSTRAQLDTAAVGLREARLLAPIAGIVGKRSVLPGEKVSAEQELLTLVDLRELELAGVVGTHQVSKLQPGQPVTVRIEGVDAPVTGRIDRIAPQAVAGTRGIPIVVLLANPQERYRAGQYASASVTLADPVQRLTVPLSAVSQASGQDYVWTVEKGVLVRRIVITGRRQVAQGRVEVTQGLPADVDVLAARFDNLKEGAAARIAPPSGQPVSAASPLADAQGPSAGADGRPATRAR